MAAMREAAYALRLVAGRDEVGDQRLKTAGKMAGDVIDPAAVGTVTIPPLGLSTARLCCRCPSNTSRLLRGCAT